MAPPRLGGLVAAAFWLALAAGAAVLTHATLNETARLMLFLLAVLVSAVRDGFWVGLLSAVAAVALFNFLLVEPHYSFDIARPEGFVTLGVFMVVAAFTGLLAGRLRDQRDDAEERARILATLSAGSSDLGGGDTAQAVLEATLTHVTALTQGRGVVLRQDTGSQEARAQETGPEEGRTNVRLTLMLCQPEGLQLQAEDMQSALQALRRRTVEFAAADGWDGPRFTFWPIHLEGTPGYVLGYQQGEAAQSEEDYREQAVAILVRQCKLALQRLAFAAAADAERRKAETEGLKATLLASLSHDLRTPLATILGSVTTLRELGAHLPAPAQADLLAAIEEEAGRLDRYVGNLLHMTRLQAGLGAQMSWLDAADVARSAVHRAIRAFPRANIATDLPDLPMIRGEAALLEQALFNLIENAVKYASGPITLSARVEHAELLIAIQDTGPGLPQPVRDWLASDQIAAGPDRTGLGLAICKGIARALGGRLGEAPATPHGTSPDETAPTTGACLLLALPVPAGAAPAGAAPADATPTNTASSVTSAGAAA